MNRIVFYRPTTSKQAVRFGENPPRFAAYRNYIDKLYCQTIFSSIVKKHFQDAGNAEKTRPASDNKNPQCRISIKCFVIRKWPSPFFFRPACRDVLFCFLYICHIFLKCNIFLICRKLTNKSSNRRRARVRDMKQYPFGKILN
jgi:hypothetical protein